jgi:MFS family permease
MTINTANRKLRQKKATQGAWFGFFVDAFDIYLPVIALVPAMIYFTDGLDAATASLVGAATFAITLIARPLGALVLGHFSDTIGRKRIAIVSAYGFGVCTFLIALLPGIHQVGAWGLVLLIALRGIDGFFLGGEYTAATPLAIEEADRVKRGFVGGLIGSAFPAAYCALAGGVFVVLQFFPAGDINSPYVQWGWRVMFIIGAVIALIFAIWYTRHVDESSAFEESKAHDGGQKRKGPLTELFSGPSLRSFMQVFVLMTGVWLAANMLNAILPLLLTGAAKMSPTSLTLTLIAANVVAIGAYIGSGAASQKWGRRRVLTLAGILIAVLASAALALVGSGEVKDPLTLVILSIIAAATIGMPFGIVPSYINERFQTGVRASAYGLGYSLSIVIPSFYAFYQLGLASFMPSFLTAAALTVIGGVLTAVGALMGPETRDVVFASDVQDDSAGFTQVNPKSTHHPV